MEGSEDIYRQLLDRLRRDLSPVAQQIEAEVAEGQTVPTDALSAADRAERALKIHSAGSRISKEDLATVPYDADDRLVLMIDALICLASSMAADRKAVSAFLTEQHVPTAITFRSEGEEDGVSELDLADEFIMAQVAYDEVAESLQSVRAELR